MNPEIINDDQPMKQKRSGGGRPFHSRLESFAEFIREQRRQRRTWQEIAIRLHTEKGCSITFQGLHQFYRRYLKRQARPHWEDGQGPVVVPPTHPDGGTSRPASNKPVLAAVPVVRPFRQPNPDESKLNDPTIP